MKTPPLIPIFQRGFGQTCSLLLKYKFHKVYFDRESSMGGPHPWPDFHKHFFYSSHSSWWDPVVAGHLCVNEMHARTIAPMDSKEFDRYKLLRFAGIFGVGEGDGIAAESFVKKELQKQPRTCVWITPQGSFSPNEIPQPAFKSGLARWSHTSDCHRIPVVIHYVIAASPKPDIYVRFGSPVARTPKASIAKDSNDLRKALDKEVKLLLKASSQAQASSEFAEKRFHILG